MSITTKSSASTSPPSRTTSCSSSILHSEWSPCPFGSGSWNGSLGNPDVSAYHEDTPAGVIFFYGKGIEKRNTAEGMKIVDIAPTILYFLGLPVAKDMDGIVQSPVFDREFTAENPIFYIGSYEETEIESR
jgi:hypothetical protein